VNVDNSSITIAAPDGNGLPKKETRVAVLFHRFGPYHHARLKAAGSRLQVTGVEFSNVDMTYAWDLVEGAEGFNRVMLFSGTAVNDLPASRIFSRVGQALDQIRPQAVAIPGWYDRCSLAALRWCGSRGVPAVVMSETTAWDIERKWLKEALKRRLIKLCAAGLVGGKAHAEYLEHLGIERDKIFFGYDAVDNDYFAAEAAEVRSQRSEARSQRGLPENFFLASARFIQKKNLSRLIEAYALYRQKAESREQKAEIRSQDTSSGLQPPSPQSGEGIAESGKRKAAIWDLVLLGDGPLHETLNSQLSTLNLHDHVLLPGFKQYDELPIYYGLASAFIHASTIEQWGLVVNEAMASGLPVLVSNRCGCMLDLVQEGRNGFSFDPYNIEALAHLMLKISADNFPLSEFGSASRQIVETVGVSAFAEGMSGAVSRALRNPVPNYSLIDSIYISALMHGFRGSPVDDMETGKSAPETRHFQSDDAKFLVFQYRGRDVLAVPQRSKAVMLDGVKRYQPYTQKRRLFRVLLSVLIRFGGTRLVAVSRDGPMVEGFGFDFKSWKIELERCLGQSIQYTIFTWPSEPSRQRLYVHLFDANHRPFAFTQLAFKNDDYPKLMARVEALQAMSKLSFKKIRVPKLIIHGRFDEASYMVIEPLPENAKTLSLKRNWDSSTVTAEFCGQKRQIGPAEIMNQSWWSDYAKSLETGHQAFHEELVRLLPLGTDVCRVHGDMGLANMVADGESIWLFDWELSHSTAPALTDAVGFFMSFTVGKIPRNPMAHLARFHKRFLSDNSEHQRLAVMLAVAFRHSCGIPDAGRLMKTWTSATSRTEV
jgi:glycosyltransferase involved in cell wall biosynthesis